MARDYLYENLGDERFQHLCQALLTSVHPDLQCMPTGQADGGRDAIVHVRAQVKGPRKPFATFQVKYTDRPDRLDDPLKWIQDAVHGEMDKIQRLAERGMSEYYILTNARGTASLDTGSIDKVQQFLDTLPIQAHCWWRNDISRRLDVASESLKLAYPEMLSAMDAMALVIGSLQDDSRARIDNAIRAYVRKQFDGDNEVRFRQVELQRSLFSLFVDVPATIRDRPGTREHPPRGALLVMRIQQDENAVFRADVGPIEHGLPFESGSSPQVGGARLILNDLTAKFSKRLVLEGGPGQGKSTLVQFVCQIHRQRLLHQVPPLPSNVASYAHSALRLPFKVDLRDYAAWVVGRDPFATDDSTRLAPDTPKSVEAYLAAQVRSGSGGADFTVSDLQQVVSRAPTLLVFDGLDEVVDIDTRRSVVDEITAGAHRLEELRGDVQIIVTSRPSAYANSPGFAEEEFPLIELLDLSRPLMSFYADRWADAKNLNDEDRAEVLGILNRKLLEPHMRDLARNPMQLSILLNLIHTQGVSLPDKRTALYDGYVGLFLSREAAKSTVVREHRDLLIDIHQYLAWRLQIEAESGTGRGTISRQDLLRTLRDYLQREGRPTDLADVLFTGIVERVFAIVQRVEGMYEFEVQPLREYFCGKYLYETAPQSRAGFERAGTIVDRFEALARNRYWLNVIRFFAGSFSKGELPSLVLSIKTLLADRDRKYLAEPRALGMLLLSDWTLTPHVKSMHELIDAVSDPVGLRMALSERGQPKALPRQCGRDVLAEKGKRLVAAGLPQQAALDVCQIVAANTELAPLKSWWYEITLAQTGATRSRWLRYGMWLNLLRHLTAVEAGSLVESGEETGRQQALLLNGGQYQFFEGSEELAQTAIDFVLDGGWIPYMVTPSKHPLPRLAEILFAMNHGLRYGAEYYGSFFDPGVEEPLSKSRLQPFEDARQYAQPLIEALRLGTGLRGLDLWLQAEQDGYARWGDRWAFRQIAAQVCARGHLPPPVDTIDLLDKSRSLIPRALTAAARRTDTRWWKEQFAATATDPDRQWVALLCLILVRGDALEAALPQLAETIEGLPSRLWRQLVATVQDTARRRQPHGLAGVQLPRRLGPKAATAIAPILHPEEQLALYSAHLATYGGTDEVVLALCAQARFALASRGPGRWKSEADLMRHAFKGLGGSLYNVAVLVDSGARRGRHPLPLAVAEEIMQNPYEFPRQLLELALQRLQSRAMKSIVTIGSTSRAQLWEEDASPDSAVS